jgi:hypothetical protein
MIIGVREMEQAKRFIVETHLSYTVEADTPDSALRAVLPMVASAENVTFEVRETTAKPGVQSTTETDPYAQLTKSVYKADEVAEILGVSDVEELARGLQTTLRLDLFAA